ncbi:ATP synthase subunit alpha [bioreactor metagenome]|uniref:ATP synthase subunit alpha n=1 Tax=bioreactor metagenome TaxID=1076179 RepID=A0A645D6U6_9ZZZZ
MTIYTAVQGYLDDIPNHDITKFEHEFLKFMRSNYAEIGKGIIEKKVLDAETEAALKKAIKEFKDTFLTYEEHQGAAR